MKCYSLRVYLRYAYEMNVSPVVAKEKQHPCLWSSFVTCLYTNSIHGLCTSIRNIISKFAIAYVYLFHPSCNPVDATTC